MHLYSGIPLAPSLKIEHDSMLDLNPLNALWQAAGTDLLASHARKYEMYNSCPVCRTVPNRSPERLRKELDTEIKASSHLSKLFPPLPMRNRIKQTYRKWQRLWQRFIAHRCLSKDRTRGGGWVVGDGMGPSSKKSSETIAEIIPGCPPTRFSTFLWL